MTAEEIKKAFDICCGTQGCTDCPLLGLERQNGCGCKHNLFVSVIDLVTEQEQEIERLKEEKKQAQIDVLNKAKEKLDSAPNGWAYTGYIDDLIEELKK